MKKLGTIICLLVVAFGQVSIVLSAQRVKRQFSAIQALAGQLGSFPYTAVGCFRDAVAKPRPFPEMLANFRNQIDLTNPNSTIAKCAAKAYIGQFQYFGIEYQAECWSGPGANLTYNKFGPSSQCLNGLGGEESFFVYKFNNPPKPLPSPASLGCFPKHASVELRDGQKITMSQLRLGQEIKTLDLAGREKYSKVIAFLHREPSGLNRFLKFHLEGGADITLTLEHLIYIIPRKSLTRKVLFARDVKLGDKVITSGGVLRSVLRIEAVHDIGLYAPLTADGSLLSDGVFVSCYAHVRSHDLGHMIMAPVRTLRWVLEVIEEMSLLPQTLNYALGSAWDFTVNFYTNALLAFVNYLPFKDSILSVSPAV
ncbi:protein hedgehog-like [Dendronephthya gigantea]|uniref:protein hedgehog-like n=1 Tax=Dendronephthya gigantea TaxID=151771 RepID=UPI00106AEB76|nr:protein hedgehog-like [Dendronephthya gigantea]